MFGKSEAGSRKSEVRRTYTEDTEGQINFLTFAPDFRLRTSNLFNKDDSRTTI